MTVPICGVGELVQAGVNAYLGCYAAQVVDVQDPEGLHRVRVTIPGLISQSSWALPMTAGGGSAARGGHVVPALGSDVMVWFLGGDLERPIYAGGWPGKPAQDERSLEQQEAGPDAHRVQCLEFEDLRITVDERDGTRALTLRNKRTDDYLTIDLVAGGLTVQMTSAILLRCLGLIDLQAAQITINGRPVMAQTRGI